MTFRLRPKRRSLKEEKLVTKPWGGGIIPSIGSSFCRGLEVIVNLIPFNPCPELPFETPSDAEIRKFTNALTQRGVEYTIRISRGRSIKGACGQLAGKLEENR